MWPHDDSFYVYLPSNIADEPTNTPWQYRVPLPQALNFPVQDDWSVGLTQVFHPPMAQADFDSIFVYTDFIEETIVGDTSSPLLCTLDVKSGSLAPGETAGGVMRTPEQLVFCRLKTGYIDHVNVRLFDEFGRLPSTENQGQTVVTLQFRRHRLPMGEQRLVLPSNASKDLYPNNTGAQYTVRLPASLNYDPDVWEVGMIYLSVHVPHLKPQVRWDAVGFGPTTGQKQTWETTPDEKYVVGDPTLTQMLNNRFRWVVQKALPQTAQGSWVKSGANQIRIATHIKQQHFTRTSYQNIVLNSGVYTISQLLKLINLELKYGTLKVIASKTKEGTTQPQFQYTQTPQVLIGSAVMEIIYEDLEINASYVLKRFGFQEGNYNYDLKQITCGATLDSTKAPATTYPLNQVDLTVWCKVWVESANNTDVLLLKRWGAPPTNVCSCRRTT